MQVDLVIKDPTQEEMLQILNMRNRSAAPAPTPQPIIPPATGGPVPVPGVVVPGTTLPGVDLAALAAAPAPVAPAPAAANADVDASGLPWDARIHASTKTQTSKGIWQKKRGVQEPEIKKVEAELRAQTVAAPAAPAMPAAGPEAALAAQAAPAPMAPAAMFPQPTAAPMPQPVMPAAAPQPEPTSNFQTLMATIQMLFNNQAINPDYMVNLNTRLGVAAITDISNDPARIGQAFQFLRMDGKII